MPTKESIITNSNYEDIYNSKGLDSVAKTRYGPSANSSKQCKTCLLSKPTSDFYRKGDRLFAQCKSCLLKRKKSKYRAKSRRQKTIRSFTFVFDGKPDPKLLVDKLKPVIEEMMPAYE